MKIEWIVLGALLLLLSSSCANYSKLPHPSSLMNSTHGALLKIETRTKKVYKGEFIAIDQKNKEIILLDHRKDPPKPYVIDIVDVRSFRLSFAKRPKYGVWGATNTLSSISHGFFMIISIPVNLIVWISTSGGRHNYSIDSFEATIRQLSKFARFPQGFPDGVQLSNLK